MICTLFYHFNLNCCDTKLMLQYVPQNNRPDSLEWFNWGSLKINPTDLTKLNIVPLATMDVLM